MKIQCFIEFEDSKPWPGIISNTLKNGLKVMDNN